MATGGRDPTGNTRIAEHGGAATVHSMQMIQIGFAAEKAGMYMRKKVAKVVLSMALSFAVATSFMGSVAEAKVLELQQRETAMSTKETHPVKSKGYANEPWCEEANSNIILFMIGVYGNVRYIIIALLLKRVQRRKLAMSSII